MLFAALSVAAVLAIVVAVHAVTQSSKAVLTALGVCTAGVSVAGVLVFAGNVFGDREDYRAALEERYGVDIDWSPSWNGEVTATKDGVEYTCEISGARMEARLLCDDPLRDEFNH